MTPVQIQPCKLSIYIVDVRVGEQRLAHRVMSKTEDGAKAATTSWATWHGFDAQKQPLPIKILRVRLATQAELALN
jgi:hypothetical protein